MEDPKQYQVRFNDLAEDTIERFWIPLWDKVSRSPLSEKLAHYFMSIILMTEDDAKDIVNEAIQKKDFMIQIVHKSMKARFDIKLDYKLTLWLGVMLHTPGSAVMFFAYLKWKLKQLNQEVMTFDLVNTRIFPMGYPTEEELQWLWDCQKVKCLTDEEIEKSPYTGNLLDIGKCYKSFC